MCSRVSLSDVETREVVDARQWTESAVQVGGLPCGVDCQWPCQLVVGEPVRLHVPWRGA